MIHRRAHTTTTTVGAEGVAMNQQSRNGGGSLGQAMGSGFRFTSGKSRIKVADSVL